MKVEISVCMEMKKDGQQFLRSSTVYATTGTRGPLSPDYFDLMINKAINAALIGVGEYDVLEEGDTSE